FTFFYSSYFLSFFFLLTPPPPRSTLFPYTTLFRSLGAMSVFLYCFREREEILKIFEMFSGQRMMTSYIRIGGVALDPPANVAGQDRKSTRLNSSHLVISYAVFCLKKKKNKSTTSWI